MHLENISLHSFKNYGACTLNFSPDINCILGPNGSGKTNMLDAIHYLSLTRSAFNTIDQQNIQHQMDFFSIRGQFQLEQKRHLIQCSCKSGSKKVLKKDGTVYSRLSDHVGQFPCVLITPYDTDLLRETSQIRRKFMDSIISQVDSKYLSDLLKYQRLLSQRNQALKNFATRYSFDEHLLASYDQPMLDLMQTISQRRVDFIRQFLPPFTDYYRTLSDAQDQVDIIYQSDVLSDNFKDRFLSNHQQDLKMQRTTLGIHKDDLKCSIGGYNVRKFGSQGQLKSFVIAMKLAQFEVIREQKGFKPILLLDDIFDKLDDLRIAKLMEMVSGHLFGQIFLTDARPERTLRILENLSADICKISVKKGTASPMES
jgi:DNA replication and repair protein RecF